jgi:tricorn protease interacting factor F2/3
MRQNHLTGSPTTDCGKRRPATPATSPDSPGGWHQPQERPTARGTVRAEEYQVDLDIEYPDGAFRGAVALAATGIDGPFDLDCEDLDVRAVTLDGAPIPFSVDAARGKLRVEARPVARGEVRAEFRGAASHTTLSGLYVSASGELPVLTTMMAPISCRRLFPCLDAPDQKAVFRIRVTTNAEPIVISNADVATVERVDERRRWTFAPTPPMATYLLYLGVGPFETRDRVEEGIRFVTATLPGKVARTERLLAWAGPLVRAYGDYYGQPYPLPKLHLVAVPDLWAGAMENWGAIAFPEIGLLVDDATSPAVERWAMETLAHEIAHQWFGNLVTMRTFNDLWLNESFATFVAAKMEARLGMRADPWSEFLIRVRPGYFGDSLESTHPIHMAIEDPKTIAESTDEITYFKGAAVVRMIDAYLGEEVFRQGVAAYLEEFRWGNARGEDLWNALAAVSGEPVTEVLRAWVERPGFPIVRVRVGSDGLHLEQSRFRFTPSPTEEPPWPIPLTLVREGAPQRVLFRSPAIELPFDRAAPLRLNADRAAFVRVWYDPELRPGVVRDLTARKASERWAFINDTWAFLLSGDATLDEYLELVRLGQAYTDYPSVFELLASLDFLETSLGSISEFRAEAVAFYRAQLARLGTEPHPGEADTDGVLRERLLVSLTRADATFADGLAARFPEIDRLSAGLRPAVALAYARSAGAAAFEPLLARARSTSDEDGAYAASEALGGLPTPELLARALAASLAPGIRASAAHAIIIAVGDNPAGRELAWTWLRQNLRELERRTAGSWALARLLELTLPSVGVGRAPEVERYFTSESFPEAANGIRKALEVLRISNRLMERVGPSADLRGRTTAVETQPP